MDADDGSVGSTGGRAKAGQTSGGGKRKRIRPQHQLVEAEAQCAALQQQLQELQGEVHSKHAKLKLIEMAVTVRNVQIAHLGMLFPDALKGIKPADQEQPELSSSSMDLDDGCTLPDVGHEDTRSVWEARCAAVTRIFGSLDALKTASLQQVWDVLLRIAQKHQAQQTPGNNSAADDGGSCTSGTAASAAVHRFVQLQLQQQPPAAQSSLARANTSSGSSSLACTSQEGVNTQAATSSGLKLSTTSSASSVPPIKVEAPISAGLVPGQMMPAEPSGMGAKLVPHLAACASSTAAAAGGTQGTLTDLAVALPLILLANTATLQLVGNAARPAIAGAAATGTKSNSTSNSLGRPVVWGSQQWWEHVIQLLLLQPEQLQLLACLCDSMLQGWLVQQQQGHLHWAKCLKKLLRLETHRKAQSHAVTMGGAFVKQGELFQESNKLLVTDQCTMLLALELITSHILTPVQVERLLWACLPGLPDPMALSGLAASLLQIQKQQQQQQLLLQLQQQQQAMN